MMATNPLDLKLPVPGQQKVLLHCCCAPCSCSIIKRLLDAGIQPTIFFYNPNIYPHEEYEKRKREVVHYAKRMKVSFVDADCDQELWAQAVQGHEKDPERGARCRICFEMRLGRTAAYANENGFRVFTTSLGISRWKDLAQVVRAGQNAAEAFPGLVYWDYNWRLQGGQQQMEEICKAENFYRQKYCGCLYSLRGSTKRNLAKQSSST